MLHLHLLNYVALLILYHKCLLVVQYMYCVCMYICTVYLVSQENNTAERLVDQLDDDDESEGKVDMEDDVIPEDDTELEDQAITILTPTKETVLKGAYLALVST